MMRSCGCVFFGLVGLSVVLASTCVIDPPLPEQARAWVMNIVSSGSGTPLQPNQVSPQTALHGAEPTPVPSAPPAAATPQSGPPSVPSPSPSPLTPAQPLSWSPGEIAWALTTLASDADLDTADQSAYPAARTWYVVWAGHWQMAYHCIAAFQQETYTSACLHDPPGWFMTALQTHQVDEQTYPQNKSWDDTWIANYQRLAYLWRLQP